MACLFQGSDTNDLCRMLYASGCTNSTAVQTLANFHDQNEGMNLLMNHNKLHLENTLTEVIQCDSTTKSQFHAFLKQAFLLLLFYPTVTSSNEQETISCIAPFHRNGKIF